MMAKIHKRLLISLCFILCLLSSGTAQSVREMIKKDPSYAACNYRIYPDSVEMPMTPAPEGKHPFYISHYGRHGSRYINNRKGYDIPYKMMLKADSLGLLTTAGHQVLKQIRTIINDSEGQWGDLTGFGQLQMRHICQRMMNRFPEVLSGDAHVDARSTVVNRCILSMGSFMMEMAKLNPQLQITMRASKRDMWYLNHQDKLLRKMPDATQEAYDAFVDKYSRNPKLMKQLFTDPDAASKVVDETWLNYYIIKMGLFQLNTHFYRDTFLTDLFDIEDLYNLWKTDNVWWYLNHGSSELNGGDRPFTQRYLLRQIIADADSCLQLGRSPRLAEFRRVPHGLQHPVGLLPFGHQRPGCAFQGAPQRTGGPAAHDDRLCPLLSLERLPRLLSRQARQIRRKTKDEKNYRINNP